jgi:hypothetical protein
MFSGAATQVASEFREMFSKTRGIVLLVYALIAASIAKLKSPEKVLMKNPPCHL